MRAALENHAGSADRTAYAGFRTRSRTHRAGLLPDAAACAIAATLAWWKERG
jgi:hypothetical protein